MMQNDYSNDIKAAVDVLRKGGVILYPTDTVWGIGCDATNAEAVKRIYKIKQRDDHKAMITLVADLAALERTVEKVPDVAYELIECADRPLTIVYDKGVGVTPELMGDDRTLAVRLTTEKFSAALCRALRRPLVSTSANISGQPTAKSFKQISQEIIDAVDYVCTSRRDEPVDKTVRPSMVMRLSDDGLFKILRK
jgi:L-threonylcarbamoyladenylate synthase